MLVVDVLIERKREKRFHWIGVLTSLPEPGAKRRGKRIVAYMRPPRSYGRQHDALRGIERAATRMGAKVRHVDRTDWRYGDLFAAVGQLTRVRIVR